MLRRIVSVAAVILGTVPCLAQVSTWEIDPVHSGAHFTIRHLMVSNVRGEFRKVTGTVNLDEKDISKSRVEAVIDATTIDTHEERRDNHLKSPDFFDVAKYPTITFKSKAVTKQGEGKFKVLGDLTMHGVTKEATLEVEGLNSQIKDQRGNLKAGASATTKLNRRDFGLTWNRALEAGGVTVGDEVGITIDVELIKKMAQESSTAPPASAK
jgi:polyisoprenoid-binding protein YceI